MANENVGTAIARIIALSGGAIAGVLLANWFDKTLSDRAQRKSEYDKTRYAQGLGALPSQPPTNGRIISSQPHIIKFDYSSETSTPETDEE